jgi:hypothetical protein
VGLPRHQTQIFDLAMIRCGNADLGDVFAFGGPGRSFTALSKGTANDNRPVWPFIPFPENLLV